MLELQDDDSATSQRRTDASRAFLCWAAGAGSGDQCSRRHVASPDSRIDGTAHLDSSTRSA